MKAFHFTLEALRTLRQRQENDAMEQYAQALLGRQQALDRLDAVQKQMEESWADLRARMASGCNAVEASQASEFHRALEKRREECAKALTLAERRVNTALHAMLGARQQREIVDKCFDKQKLRYQREEQKIEQKVLDDLAARRSGSSLSWNRTELQP